MIISAYSRFLESENRYLKDRIEALEQRNHELTLAFRPVTAQASGPQHQMRKTASTATCSCGWTCANADPVELQNAITAHFGNNSATKRKSWPQIRSIAEAESSA